MLPKIYGLRTQFMRICFDKCVFVLNICRVDYFSERKNIERRNLNIGTL